MLAPMPYRYRIAKHDYEILLASFYTLIDHGIRHKTMGWFNHTPFLRQDIGRNPKRAASFIQYKIILYKVDRKLA